ncbi:hypothetical protein EDC19_1384 [Natranaerovirga hydrolytica]|uniref:Uncharacterized protein n=1 Tax=Natranaerovirga hydrolytica TaxID=680378 RepID=A0A4R1ML22_9FIRM|nr:hypothetical protein [Natranaerovirga hydrolytica]TCK93195.1 hypothetical protein EDC19_1384 [Natranaerovirga hydrolytica]
MKKSKSIVAYILIIVILIPTAVSAYAFLELPRKAEDIDKSTYNLIQDLSNETGTHVEDILRWYEQGFDWNQIIRMASRHESQGEDLFDLTTGLKDVEEKYSEEEILEARQRIDSVVFKLEEVISLSKEDKADYEDLMNSIHKEEALYWTLTLKDLLGSYNEALNEYLIAIQLELDLYVLLEDQDIYEQEKFNQQLLKNNPIITIDEIEKAVLEMLNNHSSKEEKDTTTTIDVGIQAPKVETIIPEVKNPAPVNPLEAIQEEINTILPQ